MAIETDWFEELNPEQQSELMKTIKEVDEGKAQFVSNLHVRDKVKQLFDEKRKQKSLFNPD